MAKTDGGSSTNKKGKEKKGMPGGQGGNAQHGTDQGKTDSSGKKGGSNKSKSGKKHGSTAKRGSKSKGRC